MKKWILCFFSLFLFLPFMLVGCGQADGGLTSYHIEAVYDKQEQTLSCVQEVNYVNMSENALDQVCFSLYANAFEEGQKSVPTSYQEKAYPNGESYGGISFDRICVNGKETTWKIEEENHNILQVQTAQFFPNERVIISMKYTLSLANVHHRLGFGENCVNFGNFFPIACVYENGSGFVKNKLEPNGDPFYSEVSNFEVEITCPDEYVVASSGVQTKTSKDEGKKTVTCQAKNVRDFAFVLSTTFQVISSKADDVQVNYFYYDDENAEKHLETATKAVSTFSNLFGDYPYRQLSVVKTNFCFGGMEYPNLVMIADDVPDDGNYDYVIVHEIAHQWWYGMVGNNEYAEPWVDEGLTEYSSALFFENNPQYGIKYDIVMDNACEIYKNFVKVFTKIKGDCDQSMNRNLSEFDTEPEYVNCTYTKGMLLFDSLRQTLGKHKFMKCLQNYFEEYAFQNSSAEKMIASFSKTAKINLSTYFKSWLDGTVVIN